MSEPVIAEGCTCPGGWTNCLYWACRVCSIADVAEEPYPCDMEPDD